MPTETREIRTLIDLQVEEGDAAEFVRNAEAIARGICRAYRPPELVVLRIDNWFDHKWVGFTGKFMGLMGFWSKKLVIPPFVPNRICWQHRYKFQSSPDRYEIVDPGPALHVDHAFHKGMTPKPKRLVATIAPKTALIWFSGKSEETDHGAVMAYFPLPDGYWTWYAGLTKKDEWQISRLKGISRSELEFFLEELDSALAAPSTSA